MNRRLPEELSYHWGIEQIPICSFPTWKKYGSCCTVPVYLQSVYGKGVWFLQSVWGILHCCSLKEIAFQANVEETTTESDSEVALNFAQVDTVVAIPEPNKNLPNMVSFVKAVAQCMKEGKEQIIDEWGQAIKGGQSYLEVWYLSQHTENNKWCGYKVDKRKMYIFKESIVSPFIQAERDEGKFEPYFITNEELCLVVDYVQTKGMCHL